MTVMKEGLLQRWSRFWLTPVDPIGLHALRVMTGLLLLGWLLPLAGEAPALFGTGGWFDARAFVEASRLPEGTPAPGGWSLLYLCGSDARFVQGFYWASMAVLVLFTLGIVPRITAVLTWLITASFVANPVTSFEADYLLILLAFYVMVGYLLLGQWGQRLTVRERLLGPHRSVPSHGAGLAMRLVQVHFAIVLVTSGLHKLQFGDWWAGVAYWYPLNPPFEVTRASLQARSGSAAAYLGVLSLLQYAALAWQLTFPLFAWKPAWRPVLVLGGLLGWVGSLWIYRQPLFGPILFVVCLSYLRPEEWRRVFRPALARAPRRNVNQGGPVHV